MALRDDGVIDRPDHPGDADRERGLVLALRLGLFPGRGHREERSATGRFKARGTRSGCDATFVRYLQAWTTRDRPLLLASAASFPPRERGAPHDEAHLRRNPASRRHDQHEGPVWFMFDGQAVYFTTAPGSHKVGRLRRVAPCWWGGREDGPHFEGRADLVTDPAGRGADGARVTRRSTGSPGWGSFGHARAGPYRQDAHRARDAGEPVVKR